MSFVKTSSDDAVRAAGDAALEGALGDVAAKVTGKGKEVIEGAAPGFEGDLPFFEEKAITSSIPQGAVSSFAGGLVSKVGDAIARKLGGSNLELHLSSRDHLDVR